MQEWPAEFQESLKEVHVLPSTSALLRTLFKDIISMPWCFFFLIGGVGVPS